VVGNVELGKMNEWVRFYEQIMGFTQMITSMTADQHRVLALMSKVMQNVAGASNCPSTSQRRAAESRRSRSTWTSTAPLVCSIWP